jgi:hypothetical protein
VKLLFDIALVVGLSTVLGLTLFFGLALYNHYVADKKYKEELDFYDELLDEMDRRWTEKRAQRQKNQEQGRRWNDNNRWVS